MATTLAEDIATLDLVLVDDHALVRQGLRAVLEREADLRVVAETASAGEALAAVDRHRPDVVLLDLKSDARAFELCEELARRDVAVVALTASLDDELVLRAVRAGVRGYVVTDVDAAVLVRAIHTVARGESAFDVRSAAAMLRGGAPSAVVAPLPHQLTAREVEVLDLLAHGLSNRDIGARLYISETTAKFHVGNILRKLEVTRRAEAVYAAGKLGLI